MKPAITLALVLGLFAGSTEGAAMPKLDAKCLPPKIPALESMILLHDRWLRAPLEGFHQEHLDTIPALQRTLAVRRDEAPGSSEPAIGDVYILFFVPAQCPRGFGLGRHLPRRLPRALNRLAADKPPDVRVEAAVLPLHLEKRPRVRDR